MKKTKIKRALLSVYDKTGIVDFARVLSDEFGVEIISTGGTATLLKDNHIPVTLVEEVTGFPEMMDGRVKTLHPKIHAAILADRDNPEHMRQLEAQGIEPIDMVVVNLYPFEKTIADPDCTFEQAIEMIDIGGPCMLRAAAKNHKHVLVSCDDSYDDVLHFLRATNDPADPMTAEDLRERGAMNAFRRTAKYDAAVTEWLSRREDETPQSYRALFLFGPEVLRYGENPHQTAEQRTHDDREFSEAGLSQAVDENEGELSFNNFVDGNAALELCKELVRSIQSKPLDTADGSQTTHGKHICVFIKHTNACGAGMADDPVEAYRQAYLGDPNAAMGGVLACSFAVDAAFAEAVMDTYARWGKAAGAGGFFAEVWIAPGFDEDAIELIRTKKGWGQRVRLLSVGDMTVPPNAHELEYKSITSGMLMQTRDLVGLNEEDWKIVTKRKPTKAELADLRLAWLICKHTKSNAITVCKDQRLIGNGAGQMSRVMSCRIATWLAKENGHKERLGGAAAASDAFFPFRDGPEILIDAGILAIIQPGGSKRDEDTIQACDERGVAMIFTGTRHFKH